MSVLLIVISILIGYLIGSLNFAIIVCKLTKKEDIRHFGSKNAGMTNMLRIYGKGPAIATLVGDVTKGAISILICWLLFFLFKMERPVWLDYMVGFASILGHSFPVFYQFRGGKGVLMALGIILLLTPVPTIGTFAVFLIILACTKIVSISSIISCASAPLWNWLYGYLTNDPNTMTKVICIAIMALFIIFMHRSNIVRLIKGEEPSFRSFKKDK